VAELLSRLAWSLAVLTLLVVAADITVSAQAVSLTSETAVAVHGFPFVDGACLGCALMGAVVISRYQRHPIGWLLIAIGLSTSISLLTEAYAYWVLESDGPGTREMGGVCAWLAQLFGGQVVIALLALMFLLAPDGHFVTRRWRNVALVPALGTLLCLAAILTVDPRQFDLLDSGDRFGPTRVALLSIGFLMISLGMVLALASMVRRLRGSTGEERQQLRLIALAAGLSAAGLVVLAVAQSANGGRQTWVSGVPLFASFFLMPILFAVAVLRYRLYDLDVVINRTLLVAAGTAFAAVGYITLVVVTGGFVEGRTGGFWVSLLATTLVALAFQPLRRVVVRLADRAAYGSRAHPYAALAEFSHRLAEAPDPDELLPAVAEAAARAVSGRGAQATLDIPGATAVSGTWGWWADGQEPDQVVPVQDEGRELGRIAVTLPRGRTLRPSDLRLLEALADQTAVAFRNTALAGALADRVAELDRTTRALAESRVRLIAADDAGRRALDAAIARDVLPFLQTTPEEIGRARLAVAEGADPGIDALVDGTNAALEALRELTRGVFPTQLVRSGLAPTLSSLVARSPGGAELTVGTDRRYPPRVEAAVYFCCVEALRADGGPISIELTEHADRLVLRISGAYDGVDLRGVQDRGEVTGGYLHTAPGELFLTIPVEPTPDLDSAPAGRSVSLLPGR
jgi:N-terminal 7TM region of histidine kinase